MLTPRSGGPFRTSAAAGRAAPVGPRLLPVEPSEIGVVEDRAPAHEPDRRQRHLVPQDVRERPREDLRVQRSLVPRLHGVEGVRAVGEQPREDVELAVVLSGLAVAAASSGRRTALEELGRRRRSRAPPRASGPRSSPPADPRIRVPSVRSREEAPLDPVAHRPEPEVEARRLDLPPSDRRRRLDPSSGISLLMSCDGRTRDFIAVVSLRHRPRRPAAGPGRTRRPFVLRRPALPLPAARRARTPGPSRSPRNQRLSATEGIPVVPLPANRSMTCCPGPPSERSGPACSSRSSPASSSLIRFTGSRPRLLRPPRRNIPRTREASPVGPVVGRLVARFQRGPRAIGQHRRFGKASP